MAKNNEEAIEKLLEGIDFNNLKTEEITGKKGLLKLLTKRVLEKAMATEMNTHLGYNKYKNESKITGNARNGKSSKTIKTEIGDVNIAVPRDRNGDFEPQIVKKHQRRFEGFDDKIISMYARGMTNRDIQSHLEEIYGVEVSADLISTVTDGILTEVKEWQNRPLDS